ncbi:Leukotoxin export ATP-binding protein LtxB [compost metagenome]
MLLARALLLDPPILLLDEPTSAMDHSSEEALRHKLHDHCRDKTLLLVTHRTSMLSLVDRLVVLDGGRIVADGPKDAVIEALRNGQVGQAAG